MHNGNKLLIEQPLPLVTVVITCYNQARFLGEAIEKAVSYRFGRQTLTSLLKRDFQFAAGCKCPLFSPTRAFLNRLVKIIR